MQIIISRILESCFRVCDIYRGEPHEESTVDGKRLKPNGYAASTAYPPGIVKYIPNCFLRAVSLGT